MARQISNPRIAVIGAGTWGMNHVRVLDDLGYLAAIVDERIHELDLKQDVQKFKTIGELLHNQYITSGDKIDAAIVATPTDSHYVLARELLQEGIHILIEKPFTPSTNSSLALKNLADNMGLLLTCGYIERFNPAIAYTKSIIKDPMVVELHRENIMPVHIKDVGIIFDTAVHDIDLAIYLMNKKPKQVYCRTRKYQAEHETIATILLTFEDGSIATIHANWNTPKKIRTFNIVDKDQVITGNFITQEVMQSNLAGTIIPRLIHEEPLRNELKHFIECIKTGLKPLVKAEEAILVTKVANACILSAEKGEQIEIDDSN